MKLFDKVVSALEAKHAQCHPSHINWALRKLARMHPWGCLTMRVNKAVYMLHLNGYVEPKKTKI